MRPHILAHVPPSLHQTLEDLCTTTDTYAEIAERRSYSQSYIGNEAMTIRLMFGLKGNAETWRLMLTRMYYGIDPCWCQKDAA